MAASERLTLRCERFVEGILADFALLPFGLPEARVYAQFWADLERRGLLIGERDLQIAATAAAGEHAIATLNRREFAVSLRGDSWKPLTPP